MGDNIIDDSGRITMRMRRRCKSDVVVVAGGCGGGGGGGGKAMRSKRNGS